MWTEPPTSGFSGPDFVVGGAPKCGTTTLCDGLASHPGVFVTDPKEPSYYIEARPEGKAGYSELYAQRQPDQVTGEGSTWYLANSWRVAPALYADRPDCRLVFCVRDPIERVYSHYWFRLHYGVIPSATTFSDFADDLCGRRDDPGRYTDNLQRFADTFGRDAILVVLSEDLQKALPDVLASVCAHIGADPTFQFASLPRSNVTRYPRWPRTLRTLGRVAPGLSRWAAEVPALRPFRSRGLFSEHAPKPEMDPDVRAHLAEKYAPDVEALSLFTGRDLSGWLRS